MKTSLRCPCGQRILKRDVMQKTYYVRQFGPSYVYIKYRCTRCKKLGEHFVKQDEWTTLQLKEMPTEFVGDEAARFEHLGEITAEEMQHFREQLNGLKAIPRLAEETEGP
ncbi:MAG: hypothetical protein KGJ62_07340 [Armatimonadetes bacterium]|nr:hypothetical protein [Armatimonadota bacterium]MDE2206953.1 hypothetical protein [Armatimonadota bacterium]